MYHIKISMGESKNDRNRHVWYDDDGNIDILNWNVLYPV